MLKKAMAKDVVEELGGVMGTLKVGVDDQEDDRHFDIQCAVFGDDNSDSRSLTILDKSFTECQLWTGGWSMENARVPPVTKN